VVDLDPITWRNLGKYFEPDRYIRAGEPAEHGLFVLHDEGTVLRVVDNQRGPRRDLDLGDCSRPREVARRLLATGEWARVHVIDKRHLAQVARQAQATPRRDLTLDAYYHLVYRLVWDNSDGYVCAPPHPGHWNGWTYSGLKRFVNRLPPAASLALGVFDQGTVAIGLILEFRDGLIRRVTTFEALDAPPEAMRLSAEFFDLLWSNLESKFAPPGGVLLCTAPAFDAWLAAEDKAGCLERAARDGPLFWRLRLRNGAAPQ
jgi:hypothetical protein